MKPEFLILSKNIRGSVFKCHDGKDKICLMFNNITQCFTIHEFIQLKRTIELVDIEQFFAGCAYDRKFHMKTESDDLYFSFRKEELKELKDLLITAEFRLNIESSLSKNLN